MLGRSNASIEIEQSGGESVQTADAVGMKKSRQESAGFRDVSVLGAIRSSVQMFQRLGNVIEFVLDRLASHVADARSNEAAGCEDEERVETNPGSLVGKESFEPAPDRFAPGDEINDLMRVIIMREGKAGLILMLPYRLRLDCFAAMANGEVDGLRQRRALGEFNPRAVAGIIADHAIVDRLPPIEVDGRTVKNAPPASFPPFIHRRAPHLPIVHHNGALHTL